MVSLPVFIISIIIAIFVSFFLGIVIGTFRVQDLLNENDLLNKQLDKYKKHCEYQKLDVKVLDDDIELDKFMDGIKD